MLSEIVDARSSDVLLNPLKTLPAASVIGGASEMALPSTLLIVSEIAPERVSDVLLSPVKSLLTASDRGGASGNPLRPLKSLPRASEIGGDSDANFPADFAMLSDI